ncbi:MAG: protein kinase [Kofleriaceae bacterium]|nr:protein kinase [Kofleriaceae bacterium]
MSSTRDVRPPGSVSGSAREATESIDLGSDDLEPASLDSLAHGSGLPREDMTKVESPAARSRPGDRSGERAEAAARAARPRPAPTPSDPDAPEHRVGHTFGSYKVLELIGKGGMGYVYRAEHTKLGREVALKLLRADYAKRRDAVARFFQEARTVNRIRHRNIVDVTDLVELPDGTTFIIMELLRGQSLGRWVRSGVDLPRSLAVLIQICDALAAAHAVGVIHRDLKPDNVIILPTADGAELVKLLDFGVAKLMNRDDEDFALETAAGAVIGTPAYMSPEQAGGMQIDARSDIYSIGAIMYELYCKQPMFKGRSFGEYVRKHLSEQPPRPSTTAGGAGMDDRLEAAILRAIEKAPDRRFASIGELRDILLHLLGAIETRPPMLASLSGAGTPGLPGLAPALPGVGTLPPPAMTALGTPADPVRPVPYSTLPPPDHAPAQASTVHLGPGAAVETPSPGAHVSGLYYPGATSSGPGHASTPGSGSGLHYSWPGAPASSPGHDPSGQYPGLRQTHQVRGGTPMWVWLAGGALAIALGIGGAAWIASGDEPAAIPPATPVAGNGGAGLPAVTPPVTATPARVSVTLKSSPAAQVFALGETSALCTTPCTFEVDPASGGAPDRRQFVLRAKEHKDATVEVALAGERVSPPLVALAPLVDPDPAEPGNGLGAIDPMPGEPDLTKGGDGGNRGTGSGRPGPGRTGKSGKPTGKSGVAPVGDLTGSGASGSGKPAEGKAGNGGKIDKIDKTDTIDPFK